MPTIPYNRKTLAKVVANEGHDAASAASLFNRHIDFIEKEQGTPEYQNYLKFFLNERNQKEIQREIKIAEDESGKAVAKEKVERIKSDTEIQGNVDQNETANQIDHTEFRNRFDSIQNEVDNIDVEGAVIQDFEIIDAQQGIPKTIYRQYRNGQELKQNFRAKWYAGIIGINNRVEMFGDEKPINLSFEPAIPAQDQLKRLVAITFTPVVRGLHIADFYLE